MQSSNAATQSSNVAGDPHFTSENELPGSLREQLMLTRKIRVSRGCGAATLLETRILRCKNEQFILTRKIRVSRAPCFTSQNAPSEGQCCARPVFYDVLEGEGTQRAPASSSSGRRRIYLSVKRWIRTNLSIYLLISRSSPY